jgi:SpoVK/Ycf46/Vps4 family AAA+-type ATPase
MNPISLKSIQNILLCSFLLHSTLFCSTPENSEFESYLEKIDQLLSRISDGTLRDVLILAEKRKLIHDLMTASSDDNSKKENQESQTYEPKIPKPLSEEEKKQNINQRISKKYIGKIPPQIENVIFYFTNHEVCLKNNLTIYNRLLLHGRPGTGKTHLVKILSEELQIPMMSFSATTFSDKYIGEASRKLRKAFEVAQKYGKPVFIFIDEIDALAKKRTDTMHQEYRGTLITLLTELQELQNNKNIFIFVATNDLKALDPALRDRFGGSLCEIKELNTEQRAALFKKLFAEKGIIIDNALARRFAEVTEKSDVDELGKHNIFSNREIEYIVSNAVLEKFKDCHNNPKNCDQHLCKYVRKAIDSTGKSGSFAYLSSSYCDGI